MAQINSAIWIGGSQNVVKLVENPGLSGDDSWLFESPHEPV